MAKGVQMVVFDIAGTTLKDNGEIALAFQSAFLESGYEVSLERINLLMGYQKPEAIAKILGETNGDQSVVADLVPGIHKRFTGLLTDYYGNAPGIEPLPYVTDVFTWLHQNGIRIGLNTGFSKDITGVILQRLGWATSGIVDHVVSSDEVKAGRPHPYMIRKLMNDAGILSASEVIKVGDTEVDVKEGRNAGCLCTVAVTTGAFAREQLQYYSPDFIIDDLMSLIPIVKSINQHTTA